MLEHLAEMVVKETSLSGGYEHVGRSSAPRKKRLPHLKKNFSMIPDRYIAQPTISLSTSPSFINNEIVPRHIDLRAFIICQSREINVLPRWVDSCST